VVMGDIERPRVCYSLNPEALAPLAGLLNTILERGAEGRLGGSICCAPGKDC
jgi:ArsR family transcriptional regulator, arsenate/arsenite/antimonite-responsive transcriptional repressor